MTIPGVAKRNRSMSPTPSSKSMPSERSVIGVDWPVDCTGNLSSEAGASCKVDVATIAEQILANEAKQQVQDAIEEKAGSFIKKLFGD